MRKFLAQNVSVGTYSEAVHFNLTGRPVGGLVFIKKKRCLNLCLRTQSRFDCVEFSLDERLILHEINESDFRKLPKVRNQGF